VLLGKQFSQTHEIGLNDQFSAVRHGVSGIDGKIHDGELDLAAIHANLCSRIPRQELRGDVLSQQVRKHFHELLDHVVQVHGAQILRLLAAEGQELRGDRRTAICRLANLFRILGNGLVLAGLDKIICAQL